MIRGEILRRAAVPAAALAMAIGAAGCGGGDGLKYGPKIEAKLQKIIEPEMQRLASVVIAANQLEEGLPPSCVVAKDKSSVTDIEVDFDGQDTFEVVARNLPGTCTPDPEQVLFVGIQDETKIPGGETINMEYQLTAPGSHRYKNVTVNFPDHHDGNNRNGYSAFRYKIISKDDIVDQLSTGQLDTNHGTVVTDPYGIKMSPLQIARDIANSTRQIAIKDLPKATS